MDKRREHIAGLPCMTRAPCRVKPGTMATSRVLAVWRMLLGPVLDYALPPRCPGCGTIVGGDHRFCLPCWQRLDFLGGPACPRCGVPFEQVADDGTTCEPCTAAPPAFDAMAAAVVYGEIARRLALKLKYGGRIGIARTMAQAMARLVPDGADLLVVPVPLHRWRLWRRGFNQAALIATALARAKGCAAAPRLLARTRATPMLRGLGPEARERAVRDAFVVTAGEAARLAGARVLLVDDVYTTGATADACARALRAAGAAEVRLVCWARVVRGER